MVLDYNELELLLISIGKKIGITTDEKISIGELIKKIYNQNLTYQNEVREINLLKPSFKNSFFIKNVDLIINNEEIKNSGIDADVIHLIKMVNNRQIEIKDMNGKKIRVNYNDSNIKVKIKKELPLDLYFKLLNG